MNGVAAKSLSGTALRRIAAQAGGVSQWVPSPPSRGPIFKGRLGFMTMPSGLSLHFTDGKELQSVSNSMTLPPRVSFLILLEGDLAFAFDGHPHRLQCQPGRALCAAMLNFEPLILARHLRSGAHLQKVHVSVEPSWLASRCPTLYAELEQGGLARQAVLPQWQASQPMVVAAQAVLKQAERDHELQQLTLEALALTLMTEGLKGLQKYCSGNATQNLRQDQVEAVRQFLERELFAEHNHRHTPHGALGLSELARQYGMSVSTLQRHFRKSTGTTVREYWRRQRLECARQALISGGASIGEAAFLAGYRHSANFIAAYKRTFGQSPGAERLALSSDYLSC